MVGDGVVEVRVMGLELHDSVVRPGVLVVGDVGCEQHMRRVEDLHLGLVLRTEVPPVLELLGEGVEVLDVLCLRPTDVEAGDLLSIVGVLHVGNTT